VPMPFSPTLERAVIPTWQDIATATRALVHR
jgi:hypothetical protein